MIYKASLGTTSILITFGTSLLLASIVGFALYRTIFANHIAESIILILTIVGIVTMYLVVYLYRPVKYVVDEKQVTIKRAIKDVTIPINEIQDALIVRRETMGWRERVGGNGGLFGFYGNFKNNFGMMTWYATKLKNYVLIETLNDGRIIVTPDNTDMVKEIRKLIGK